MKILLPFIGLVFAVRDVKIDKCRQFLKEVTIAAQRCRGEKVLSGAEKTRKLEGWYFTNDKHKEGPVCYKYHSGVTEYTMNRWRSKKECKDNCISLEAKKPAINKCKLALRSLAEKSDRPVSQHYFQQAHNHGQVSHKQPHVQQTHQVHVQQTQHVPTYGSTYESMDLPSSTIDVDVAHGVDEHGDYEDCYKIKNKPAKRACKKHARKKQKKKSARKAEKHASTDFGNNEKELEHIHKTQIQIENDVDGLMVENMVGMADTDFSTVDTVVEEQTYAEDTIWQTDPEKDGNQFLTGLPNIQMKLNDAFATKPKKAFKTYNNVKNQRPWAPSWTQEKIVIEKCRGGSHAGHGQAKLKRFFFDSDNLKCQEFIYTGIGGNLNNYDSMDHCELNCVPACHQPQKAGLCRGYFPRWAYNSKKQICEKFIYTGCIGNSNRFESELECYSVCAE